LRLPSKLHVLHVPDLLGWSYPRQPLVPQIPLLRKLCESAAQGLMNAYMGSRAARRAMDRLGIAKLITQSPFFYLPKPQMRQALLAELPADLTPRLVCSQPALIEVWQLENEQQIHLVNYAEQPQTVRLCLHKQLEVKVISPDETGEQAYYGDQIEIPLDIYKILQISGVDYSGQTSAA
jgi:hypothetical protein